jgi:hypothetical protein
MTLVILILLGGLMVGPSWADSPEVTTPPGRFRLLHDLEDILTWTWGEPGPPWPCPRSHTCSRRRRSSVGLEAHHTIKKTG